MPPRAANSSAHSLSSLLCRPHVPAFPFHQSANQCLNPTQLTFFFSTTSALFGSFKAHTQPRKPFVFLYFRTLVIKHPGVALGCIRIAPRPRFRNSFTFISFAGPYILTPMESHRYKRRGGGRVRSTFQFPISSFQLLAGVLPTPLFRARPCDRHPLPERQASRPGTILSSRPRRVEPPTSRISATMFPALHRFEASLIHRNIFRNDQLLPIEKIRLSPGQAGLICGWGLFTTIRIVRGEAFAYERHWRRLEKDAAIIRLPMPYSGPKVRVHLQEVIRANKVSEGCARIYLVYNQAGFWRSDEPMPQVDLIIYTSPLPQYREPIRLALREHGRHAASPLAGVKSISWLNNVWSVAEAQKEGFDEVVLLNERGEVAECTAANIFVVKNEKIFTPPLTSGCLEGVTRGILMELAPEAGLAVAEQTLHPENLYSADEVFISSTNRNLIGVGEIAGKKIPVAPGPVTKRLSEIFDLHVSEYVSRRLASALP
jgi:branched-chain amino acid aminotransferase